MNIVLIIILSIVIFFISTLSSKKTTEFFNIDNCENCYQIVDCTDPKNRKNKKCQYQFRGSWIRCPKGTLNEGELCYDCPWKRPGLNLLPDSGCCQNKCCKRKKKNLGIPYYCRRYGTCIKKYSKDGCRSCGMQTLYNTPAKIFDTLEECRYDVNPYAHLNKEECLKQTSAGWCTDYLGNGVCVPGTPEGPIDQLRWDTCYVNQRSDKNSWNGGQLIPKGLKLL